MNIQQENVKNGFEIMHFADSTNPKLIFGNYQGIQR